METETKNHKQLRTVQKKRISFSQGRDPLIGHPVPGVCLKIIYTQAALNRLCRLCSYIYKIVYTCNYIYTYIQPRKKEGMHLKEYEEEHGRSWRERREGGK